MIRFEVWFRGVNEKTLLNVYPFYILSIYPSAHSQLSERFSGNQLYLNANIFEILCYTIFYSGIFLLMLLLKSSLVFPYS